MRAARDLFLPFLILGLLAAPGAGATPVVGVGSLIGVGRDGGLFVIDPDTGEGQLIGETGFFNINSLTVRRGRYLASDGNDNLIQIDPFTGQAVAVAKIDLGGAEVDIRSMAASPSGQLFALNHSSTGSGTFWRIDSGTGEGTLLGFPGPTGGYSGMDFRADGVLYGWDFNDGLVRINSGNGSDSDVNPDVGGPILQSIAFAPDGSLIGIGQPTGGPPDILYDIDPDTGVATQIAQTSGLRTAGIRGLAYVVPEPSTAPLFLAGLAALAARRRSRRSRPVSS